MQIRNTSRLPRLLAGLPDAITAGFFLALWIAPQWLGPNALRTGLLMMLVEFILMHATGILGSMALADAGGSRRPWKPILAFSGLYLLFIAGYAWGFMAWWPLLALAWLVAGERVEVRLELEAAASTSERLGEQLDQQGKVDLYGIYFDTDKATLKDESTSVLEQVRALLEARPQLQLVVAGHTDAEGGDDHNMALSARRAEAVVAWLGEHGIDVSRLRAEGHGESRPVANNATGEGRALNRRVEIRDAAGD